MTTKAATIEAQVQNSLERERLAYETAQLWIRGTSIVAICNAQGRHKVTVLRDLQLMRVEMAEWNRASLEERTAERLAALRNILDKAWTAYEEVGSERLLRLVHAVEQTIARIQGVLTDGARHLHLGPEFHVKLYDFEDQFPAIDGVTAALEADAALVPQNLPEVVVEVE